MNERIRYVFSRVSAVLILAISTGCTGGSMDDLVTYVEEVKVQDVPPPAPLPYFPHVEPFRPNIASWKDPFEPFFTAPVIPPHTPRPGRHPEEELERFSLDSLRMVGMMAQDEHEWGLIRDPDGLVHRIAVGNYLGRNYGKVRDVTETHIALTEIIPDDAGGWQEREATLALSGLN